jgi:hypothetical protein
VRNGDVIPPAAEFDPDGDANRAHVAPAPDAADPDNNAPIATPTTHTHSAPLTAQPAWQGRSLAQELYERRAAERRERKRVPERFSVQDLLQEPWERELVDVA